MGALVGTAVAALLVGGAIGYAVHSGGSSAPPSADTAACKLALSTSDNLWDMQMNLTDTMNTLRAGEFSQGRTIEQWKQIADAEVASLTQARQVFTDKADACRQSLGIS